MMANDSTLTRPDLSALSREDRIDIAVAVARNARWMWSEGAEWWLLVGEDWTAVLDERGFDAVTMPRVTRDPAAWGALMEEEGVWPEPVFDTGGAIVGWWGRYRQSCDGDMDTYPWTVQVTKPGIACAVAFLAKHGVEVPE